jgi:hypothetical protein
MAKMSRMSSKLAKCNMGSGSSFLSSLFILVVYVAIAYVLYRVIMYFMNMRSSAMPNVPSRPNGAGGCSTGTCGGSGGANMGTQEGMYPGDRKQLKNQMNKMHRM